MCADLSDLNVGRIGAALFVVDLAWAGIMAVTEPEPWVIAGLLVASLGLVVIAAAPSDDGGAPTADDLEAIEDAE